MSWKAVAAAVVAFATLSGCGGGGSGGGEDTGTLTLGLTDAKAENVGQVRIFIEAVTLKGPGGPAVTYEVDPADLPECMSEPGESSSCNPIDLLALQDGVVLTVIDGLELRPGRYNWARLDVDETRSFIVDEMGGIVEAEIRVPSERDLQLSGGFTILAGQRTHIVLDWDAYQGLAYAEGPGTYILKPSIHLVDMAEYGTLSGTVSGSCEADGVVYVFEGDLVDGTPPGNPDANLDDMDNNDPNPLVTSQVRQRDDGSFGYEVSFLQVGTYTVALTCDEDTVPVSETDTEEANETIGFINPQVDTITDGGTTIVDF